MSVFKTITESLNRAKDEEDILKIFHANGFTVEKVYDHCGKDFIEVSDHRCDASFVRDDDFWYVTEKRFFGNKNVIKEDGGGVGMMLGFYTAMIMLLVTGTTAMLAAVLYY